MFDILTGIQKWFRDSTPQKKLTAVLLVTSVMATAIFLILSGSAESSSDPLANTPLYFTGVLVKLLGVLLLIVILAVLYGRWMNLGLRPNAVRQLRLVETLRLSPRQALYLVSVGDQQVLIGATDQSITLLSVLDGDFSTADSGSMPPVPGLDFGSLVQSFHSNPPTDLPGDKE
jgi:flagellar biosynthetic protein FliO